MNKVNGKKASFAPIREDGSRITICYGLKTLSKDLYEWYEVYLPKKQTNALTIDIVKAAVIDDINNRVKNAIISGFVWNEKPVWLSEENQLNFFQSVAPCRLKIGEQEDGTPVYHQFTYQSELADFNNAIALWRWECLSAGWAEKDGIDWAPYEDYFKSEE